MRQPKTPLDALHAVRNSHRTAGEAAKSLGISDAYLHDLLHGKRKFSVTMLRNLGFDKKVTFVRISA